MTGRRPPELEEPELPEIAGYLWQWFWELDRGRPVTPGGLGYLGYAEIAAWSALTGVRPTPEELRVLRAMDVARLAAGR